MEFRVYQNINKLRHPIKRVLRLMFYKPNSAVKGARRTQTLFKDGGLFGFVGFAKPSHPARPLLLRYA